MPTAALPLRPPGSVQVQVTESGESTCQKETTFCCSSCRATLNWDFPHCRRCRNFALMAVRRTDLFLWNQIMSHPSAAGANGQTVAPDAIYWLNVLASFRGHTGLGYRQRNIGMPRAHSGSCGGALYGGASCRAIQKHSIRCSLHKVGRGRGTCCTAAAHCSTSSGLRFTTTSLTTYSLVLRGRSHSRCHRLLRLTGVRHHRVRLCLHADSSASVSAYPSCRERSQTAAPLAWQQKVSHRTG